jgi:hypothetical protein
VVHRGIVDIAVGLRVLVGTSESEKTGLKQGLARNHYFSFGVGLAFERRVALSRVLAVWNLDLDLLDAPFIAAALVDVFAATLVRTFPPVTARTRLGELILALAAMAALLGLPGPNLMAAA